MESELLQATIYGMASGFGVGALRWLWGFFVRRVLDVFGERLILE